MVYRGLPSKACQSCRVRRLRCNLLPAGCSQCAKRGETCPGYRDPKEPIICDQTAHTIRRSRRPNLVREQTLFALSISDDVALACFYQLCARPAPSSSRSVVASETPRNKSLVAAMRALGLVARSQVNSSSEVSHEATSYYLAALQATSKALASPDLAKADETLLSVIILTFYEARCGQDRDSIEIWTRHAEGCAALLDTRGPTQLEREDGRLLFMETTTAIIPNAVRLALPVPENMLEMMQVLCAPKQRQDEPQWVIVYGWMQTTNLRSAVVKGGAGNAQTMVKRAREIDDAISHAFDHAKYEWTYDTLSAIPEDFDEHERAPVFIHSHRNVLAAEMWASFLSCRLLLHTMMGKALEAEIMACPWTGLELHDQLKASQKLISTFRDEIFATAPQFCSSGKTSSARTDGLDNQRPGKPPLPDDNICNFVPLRSDRLPVLVTSQGHSLIWALNLVIVLAKHEDGHGELACNLLYKLANSTGIRQAQAIADRYRPERI